MNKELKQLIDQYQGIQPTDAQQDEIFDKVAELGLTENETEELAAYMDSVFNSPTKEQVEAEKKAAEEAEAEKKAVEKAEAKRKAEKKAEEEKAKEVAKEKACQEAANFVKQVIEAGSNSDFAKLAEIEMETKKYRDSLDSEIRVSFDQALKKASNEYGRKWSKELHDSKDKAATPKATPASPKVIAPQKPVQKSKKESSSSKTIVVVCVIIFIIGILCWFFLGSKSSENNLPSSSIKIESAEIENEYDDDVMKEMEKAQKEALDEMEKAQQKALEEMKKSMGN